MKDKVRFFVYRNGRNVVLWFVILVIFLYSVRVYEMYTSINSYGEQSVDGLSKNAILFRLEGKGEIDFDFLSDEKKPYAIISQPDTSIPMYLVFQSKGFFEIASGRSFSDDDGIEDNAVMLCGKYADTICDTDNLYWHGKGPYIQIGELAESGSLLTDYGVFLCEWLSGDEFADRVFILETKEHRDSERIFDMIGENMIVKGFNIMRLDTNDVWIGMMTNSEKNALVMILISIILLSTGIGFVTAFWLSQYDEERFARSLCGQEKINCMIITDYLTIQTSAFAFGIGLAILTYQVIGIIASIALFTALAILFMAVLCIKNLLGKYEEHEERRGIIL